MGLIANKVMTCVVKEAAHTLKNLYEGWTYYLGHEVVVGITEETNSSRGGISNAELLYLHEAGVPSHNIPPRPVLKPALSEKGTQEQITEILKQAAVAAMVHGNRGECEAAFHKAGMVGRDACKKWITDGGHLAPNAPATIARKGSSTPLVDTASMLNSISYAVKEKGK